ncbi:hypothetical protein EIL87_19755 [Saccharopolyspora rhizosphaerae]|uniref:Uncharacterized protein n=1 Tax=Saccharopolyspora rhizosphaerae TaxID=2492662 RepID=A0A3R8Q708_9PSEU|nr:hypothetical protein [Saccharopolyspora rhizosphaerae]RRO14541.1 hypothetical protein EIL87_19755 [Saccharopolyspora rhizosphaerae]
MMELLLSLLGWLVRAMFTAVLPFALVLGLAVLDGLVRTAVLLVVAPLVVAAYVVIQVADSAGHHVPAPRLPRLVEVPA